jgi:hypothetical protein
MRIKRPPSWWHLLHFCGWDRTCRSVHAPYYLYFHFLADEDGYPPRVDLSPPWVRRAHDRWLASLDWKQTGR